MIGTDGKWTEVQETRLPEPDAFTLVASGSLTKDQLAKFNAVISKDVERLFDDKSLMADCEANNPDEVSFTYSYTVDGNNKMSFDKCWLLANDDQKLITVTREILKSINSADEHAS